MSKRTFLFHAICLAAASLCMRLVNLLYRIYLAEKIGTEGMGLYQLIFSVFVFAITVSTAGISLSAARLISTAISSSKANTVPSYIRKCILFSLCLSIPAAAVLYLSSSWIGTAILNDSRVILPLQILAPGLPMMAVCACFKGYFLAVRSTARSIIGEFLEQAATISVTVALFTMLAPSSAELCCCAVMIGSTVGEIISCLSAWILYQLHRRRDKITHYEKSSGVFKQLRRIALPITISAVLRSGLSTVENLLIPIGYRKNGVSAASALAEYGILNGMVLPVLFFPSAILSSFGSLLVPELTESMTQRHTEQIRQTAAKSIRITLLFSIYTAAFLGFFAREIGYFFFHSAESARLIQILAILVPLWYLDIIVDNLLKGLDQQFASMRFNFYDAALRVILVWILIPLFGTKGYLSILFFSTIFNAALSLHRLIKTTSLEISIRNTVFIPVITAVVVVFFTCTLLHILPFTNSCLWFSLLTGLLLSASVYLFLLQQMGILRKQPCLFRIKQFFTTKKDSPEGLPDS